MMSAASVLSSKRSTTEMPNTRRDPSRMIDFRALQSGKPSSYPGSNSTYMSDVSFEMNSSVRLSHKQVEQYRRMKAKEYFDQLRDLLPNKDIRCDRNKILQEAINFLKDVKGMKTSPWNSPEASESGLQFEMEDIEQEMNSSKALSHNEVEQRRRQMAKQLFEELRALLPDSGCFLCVETPFGCVLKLGARET